MYFLFIARILGPVDLGLYDPVKSLIPILLILIDFSLSVVLVREIARKPEKVEKYLSNVLGIKIVFALAILLAMGLFTNFSNFSDLVKSILYLDGVVVVLDTFTLTFFAVFRGLQNMKYESLGMIGTQLVTIIFGVTGLLLGFDLRVLFIAVACGSFFNFVFSFIMLRLKLKIRVRFAWDMDTIKTFLKIALPFAIAAIFVKIYTYTDRFMLLKLAGQRFVGWYITAHKLTYALEFIPSAFAASIFPAFSSFFLSSREDLIKTFDRAMKYLIIIAVPISFGIFVLADLIIISLAGDAYETSILPLRILIAGLIVIFLNFPVGAFLNACNMQIKNTINMGITVVVNIILNIILIPKYTFNGAAIAALVSGFVLFFLGLRWVGKTIDYNKRLLFRTLGRSVLAALVMSLLLFLLKYYVHMSISIGTTSLLTNASAFLTLLVYIILGMIVYLLVLYLIKGIEKQDINFIYNKFIKKLLKKG